MYILLVGYLTLTILSFYLIIAIYKCYNGIILCWLLTLCVFILPEICLSIVLADTVYDWFSTPKGSFLLSSMISRNLVNIPCIIILYLYYRQQSKRDKSLENALNPIKKNIASGDLLKNYQNIELSEKVFQKESINNDDKSNMRMYRFQPDTLNGLHLIWNGNEAQVVASSSINSPNSSKFTSPPRYSNIINGENKCLSIQSSSSNKYDVLKEEDNFKGEDDISSSVKLVNKKQVNLNAHFMYLPPAPTISTNDTKNECSNESFE